MPGGEAVGAALPPQAPCWGARAARRGAAPALCGLGKAQAQEGEAGRPLSKSAADQLRLISRLSGEGLAVAGMCQEARV